MLNKKFIVVLIVFLSILSLMGCPPPLQMDTLSILQDLSPPVITILTPSEGSQFRSTVTVSGTISDIDSEGKERPASEGQIINSFSYFIQNQDTKATPITPNEDGSFIFTLNTSSFTKQITILLTASDLNGNFCEKTLSLQPYTQGPAIDLTAPEDYSHYATVLSVSGTVTNSTADSGISEVSSLNYRFPGTNLNGQINYNSKDGSFSVSIDVASLTGDKVLEITAEDLSGNITTETRTITKPSGGGDISGFTAVPDNKQVVLSWDPVPGADSYSIFESSFGITVPPEEISGTSHTWEGLVNGEIYTFQVTAHLPADVGSDGVSNSISKMPLSSRSFAPRVKSTGNRSITLEWTGNKNVSNYILERSSSAEGPWETIRTLKENEFRDENLDYDSIFYYRVTPANFQEIASVSVNAVPGRFGFSPLGSCDTPSEAYKIAVNGRYAYVADDKSGFQIIDIEDKTKPQITGSITTSGPSWGVAVSGNTAYLTGGYGNMEVFDVLDRTAPQPRTTLSTGSGNSITIVDNCAYLTVTDYAPDPEKPADTIPLLRKMDITNPIPVLTASCTLTYQPTGAVINGSYAYVTSDSGFEIVDITNMTLKSTHTDASSLTGAAVSGNCLLVSAQKQGIVIFDITTPLNPVQLVQCDTPGIATGIAVRNSYAYVADGSSGIQVIDISTPTSPRIVDSYDTPGFARGVTVSDNYIYVADATSGIHIFDLYKPPTPVITGSYTCRQDAYDVAVSGQNAYVSYCETESPWISGVQVIDISAPENPASAGAESFQDVGGLTKHLEVSAGSAFLSAGSAGLQVIDITHPATPRTQGSCDTSAWLSADINLFGSYAYNSNSSSGLLIMDISDPTAPIIVNNSNFSDNGCAITVSGNYAYIIDSITGLIIVDIKDPANPSKIGQCVISDGTPRDVTLRGNYAYITKTGSPAQAGLEIIDTSNPSNPFSTGIEVLGGEPNAVTVCGNYAYVAAGSIGIVIVDVKDPANPIEVNRLATPGEAQEITVRGSFAYLADKYGGLQIISLLGIP